MISTKQFHAVMCLQAIAQTYFTPGRPLVVSLPGTQLEITQRSLLHKTADRNQQQMVSFSLEHLNQMALSPIKLVRSTSEEGASETDIVLESSYIIFFWEEPDSDMDMTLREQLENLRTRESWNPRGRFVVVVSDYDEEPPQQLALQICSILWHMSKIVNIVVLTVHQTDSPTHPVLNLYTWFPYSSGNCGQVNEVVVIDQWLVQNNGSFSLKANLFPTKIPNSFMGCNITVSCLGVDPFVLLRDNDTRRQLDTEYEVAGISVELFLLVAQQMNLTAEFLPPVIGMSLDPMLAEFSNFVEGKSEVFVSTIPLTSMAFSYIMEPTIPYMYGQINWYFPCPTAVFSIEKILKTYTMPVWFVMGCTVLLISFAFWLNVRLSYWSEESNAFKTIWLCLYNAWAIMLGVSVSEQPRNWKLRCVFYIYICYCFSLVTVFQAYFVSYIVEPEYGKQIQNVNEILNSDIKYGAYPNTEDILNRTENEELWNFLSKKKQRAECVSPEMCLLRMYKHRDLVVFSNPTYVEYIASKFGIQDPKKVFCTLNENIYEGSVVMLLHRGSRYLPRFNLILRRCLEFGFLERIASRLKFIFAVEGSAEMYLAFTVSMLSPAFIVLCTGNLLSFVVFVCELITSRE